MVDFVKLLASVVEHKQNELLFLVMGLIELYKDILISTNSMHNDLLMSDITSFICERCQQDDFVVQIPEKRIPIPCRFELNKERIREIDIQAPDVISHSEVEKHIIPN